MSAFMCRPQTIYDVAECIVYFEKKLNEYFIDNKPWWIFFGITKGDNEREKISKIYRKLVNLNVHALTIRYGSSEADKLVGDIEDYDIPDGKDSIEIGYDTAVKIKCFLYQCDEGAAVNMPEYKIVETCRSIMCEFLVEKEIWSHRDKWFKYWA